MKCSCLQKESHFDLVHSKGGQVSHVCANCWLLNNNKSGHPENSGACPHAETR